MLRPSLSLFTKAASRTTVVRPPPLTPPRFIIPARAMSTEAQKPVPAGKTEFKILMLHGYTQSGPLFHTKTRALEKLLIKALAPAAVHPTLVYPTAPINLRPQDIPGYTPPEGTDPAAKTDAWAWFRKDDATGTYRGLDEGMASLAEAVKAAGGVDAVLGFSQGGAVAGLVAAALETGRRDVPPGPENDWARALREANANKPLRFAVSYSGFYATPNSLAWCYDPTVVTPTLHVLGGLDTIVEESRSRGLVDRCVDPTVVVHPGGHHVPVSKEWAMALVAFVKKHAEDAGKVQAGL